MAANFPPIRPIAAPMSGDKSSNDKRPQGPIIEKRAEKMTKRRWLKSAIAAADTDTTQLPWARGSRRAGWKSAARSRALAA